MLSSLTRIKCLLMCTVIVMACFAPLQAQIKMPGTVLDFVGAYQPINGFIWLKNGSYYNGTLSFNTRAEDKQVETGSKTSDGKPIYRTITNYYIDGFEMDGQKYMATDVLMYGDNQTKFIGDYRYFDKKGRPALSDKDAENFNPGKITFNNGTSQTGFVAIRRNYYLKSGFMMVSNSGVQKSDGIGPQNPYVLFTVAKDSPVHVFFNLSDQAYRGYNITYVEQTVDGETKEYLPFANTFQPVDKIKWAEGYITDEKDAKTAGKFFVTDHVSGFKTSGYINVAFLADGNNKKPVVFGQDPFDYTSGFFLSKKKEDEEYIFFDNAYYPRQKLVKRILETEHKDPELNFQPGKIYLVNGTELKGRIARASNKSAGFYFNNETVELQAYFSNKNVWYFTQTINGKEKKYIRVQNRYSEWLHAADPVSYFQNPFPTHVNKAASKFVTGLVTTSMAITASNINQTIANEKAKNATLKEGNVTKAIDIKAKADALDYEFAEAMYNSGGLIDIYYLEYVLLFNGQRPTIVYKKNIDETIARLTKNCDSFTNLSKADYRKMGDIDLIDETVQTLNQLHCFK